MTLICPDVSEFQRPLTDAYGRRLLIMRVSFGAHYEDKHFLANANAAARLYARGEIDGVLLYTVYLSSATPHEQFAFTWKLIGPTVPPWLIAIMIDVEHWGGQSYAISGNHSKQLNQLYALHAAKMGSWNSCIGYGNRGDLAAIWPQRDKRCAVIVASYGPALVYKKVRGAIGQQYTDGKARWGVPKLGGKALPRSSDPFGPCDHNVFPGFVSAAALRARLRPNKAAAKPAAPKAAAKPTAAKPPAKPVVSAAYYGSPGDASGALVSPNRQYALFLGNAGNLEIRHSGKHAASVLKGS